MANQDATIDYQNGTSLTSDTGEQEEEAIRPALDGEPANRFVLGRPSENLRERTERLRTVVNALKYLAEADRALLLTGGGVVTWGGVTANGGTGGFTITEDLVIQPFTAPSQSVGPRWDFNVDGSGNSGFAIVGLSASTVRDAVTDHPPRAYGQYDNAGAPSSNELTLEIVGAIGATLAVTVSGEPARHVKITVDLDAVTGTTYQNLLDFLATDVSAGALAFRRLGLTTYHDEAVTPAASLIGNDLLQDRARSRYPWDSEKHVITVSGLAALMASSPLTEGEGLAIGYEKLVDDTGGGRRQSLDEAPESSANVDLNIFTTDVRPDLVHLAIPICKVVDDALYFINGARLAKNSPGAISGNFVSKDGDTMSGSLAVTGGASPAIQGTGAAAQPGVKGIAGAGASAGVDGLGVGTVPGTRGQGAAGVVDNVGMQAVAGATGLEERGYALKADASASGEGVGGQFQGGEDGADILLVPRAADPDAVADHTGGVISRTGGQLKVRSRGAWRHLADGSLGSHLMVGYKEDLESGVLPGAHWTMGDAGDAPAAGSVYGWAVNAATPIAGTYDLKASNLGVASSYAIATLRFEAHSWVQVAFRYKLESEAGGDHLEVYVSQENGPTRLVLQDSGSVADGRGVTPAFPPGPVKVVFIYSKDESGNAASETCQIDDIEVVAAAAPGLGSFMDDFYDGGPVSGRWGIVANAGGDVELTALQGGVIRQFALTTLDTHALYLPGAGVPISDASAVLVYEAGAQVAATTDAVAGFGLADSAGPAVKTPDNVARFLIDTGAGTFPTKLMTQTKSLSGGTTEVKDTGIDANNLAGGFHVFRIEQRFDSVRFFVDGRLVATHTATLPDNDVPLTAAQYLEALAASEKSVYWDYVAVKSVFQRTNYAAPL